MKHLYIPFLLAIMNFSLTGYSQDTTLTFRFYNYQVVEGATDDTLIFDVEAKCNVENTYMTATGVFITFNTGVFGDSALATSVEQLELTQPSGYNYNFPNEPAGINRFSSSFTAFIYFPPFSFSYNTAFLSLITTEYKGIARYKMLVTGSGNLGIDFDGAINGMSGQQLYVITSGGTSATSYSPLYFENDLLNFPSTPTEYHLIISEVADPSDSNGDFVEVYNAGASSLDFTSYPHYLTAYDGSTYESVAFAGTMAPGETRVVGGPSFSAVYPGKTADHTVSFVEGNGTLSFYLTVFHPYNDGIFIDRYDGSATPYTGKHAVRPFLNTTPDTTFTPSEWKVTAANTMDMTPGSHRITLTWDGSSSATWRDTANWTPSYVPDVGHNAVIPQGVSLQPVIPSGIIATCHDVNLGSTQADK